ncbi:GNAT family N-acetyltransferase [Lacimicrobium sp. SS2-24]|uniref:GNAT family N-acetyltransferase n=1 Tax=Lacimicrobium sp. SS2-24 TaxID=2005569 RepID=UPI000B4BDA7C|nr:GNAT family N-acetyltransferase [Lacimicrobium sp. SS2-24]
MNLTFAFVNAISEIDRRLWQQLAEGAGPFLKYEFLHALEQTDCVSAQQGWQPCHLTVYDNATLIAVMPLYQKTHSYGEYIFDFAWADAYHRHGLAYYPKLISAVPFTPVTGPRLLCNKAMEATLWPQVISALKNYCNVQQLSSLHLLFTDKDCSSALTQQHLLSRTSVQFHWFNRAYVCFEDFVSTFSSRKRKNLNKERNRLTEHGIRCRWLVGEQISEQDMLDFYRCYCQTYLKRSGHSGYLTAAFFEQLRNSMADNLLLVQAHRDDTLLASALLLFDENTLYGRYWGALHSVDGLHFEVCYYQGIAFCIEKGPQQFNPGTQGEHKIQRGFEPVYCYSSHWLKHSDFHQAVAAFLKQERAHLQQYKTQATSLLPFRKN